MLAKDHALVRAGNRALLEKLRGVKLVGEASDGRGRIFDGEMPHG
jgi:DNA-binding NarL/FixJ family response regulator